ncbi:MAG: Rrf2 family transcriptional regulator, partial [bacterium]
RRQGISKRYLGQIAISLKNNFLIRGVPGKSGGYVLTRRPEEILVGSIIEAAIGPINVVDCVVDRDACMKSDYCECRPVYALINDRIREALNDFTLADIINRHAGRLPREQAEQTDAAPFALKDLCSSEFR